MNIEIHKPALVERLTMRIQTGQFQDADELIEKALDALDDALDEHTSTTSSATTTGAVVLAALQDFPCSDIDLAPPRVRLANVRDVVL